MKNMEGSIAQGAMETGLAKCNTADNVKSVYRAWITIVASLANALEVGKPLHSMLFYCQLLRVFLL